MSRKLFAFLIPVGAAMVLAAPAQACLGYGKSPCLSTAQVSGIDVSTVTDAAKTFAAGGVVGRDAEGEKRASAEVQWAPNIVSSGGQSSSSQ